MAGEAQQNDKILAEARRTLEYQRAGGRRRQPPIGRGSAQLRQQNLMNRIKLIVGSMAAIIVAAMVAGIAIGGIGFTGIMVVFLAIVAATFLFSSFPKVRVPKRADLNTGDVRHMVARTELWLELHDAQGRFLGRFTAPRRRTFPGTSVRSRFVLDAVPAGKYVGLLVADGGRNDFFGMQVELDLR